MVLSTTVRDQLFSKEGRVVRIENEATDELHGSVSSSSTQRRRKRPHPLSSKQSSPRQCGRKWTEEEQERFFEGLEKYPRGPWKAIAAHVGSRTERQTIAHAQKYRNKIHRHKRGLRRRGRQQQRDRLSLYRGSKRMCETGMMASSRDGSMDMLAWNEKPWIMTEEHMFQDVLQLLLDWPCGEDEQEEQEQDEQERMLTTSPVGERVKTSLYGEPEVVFCDVLNEGIECCGVGSSKGGGGGGTVGGAIGGDHKDGSESGDRAVGNMVVATTSSDEDLLSWELAMDHEGAMYMYMMPWVVDALGDVRSCELDCMALGTARTDCSMEGLGWLDDVYGSDGGSPTSVVYSSFTL